MIELSQVVEVINDIWKVDIRIKCRDSNYICAKTCYYYYVKKMDIVGLNLSKTANHLNQSHGTAIHHNKNFKKRKATFTKFKNHYDLTEKALEPYLIQAEIDKNLRLKKITVSDQKIIVKEIIESKNKVIDSLYLEIYNLKNKINLTKGSFDEIKNLIIDLNDEEIYDLINYRIKPFVNMAKNKHYKK